MFQAKFIGPASLIILSICGCMASAQSPEKVGFHDLAEQKLTGTDSISVKGGSRFSNLSVVVTVDIDGKVIDARADDNYFKLDPKPALAAARLWTFRPFQFEGRPVQAIGSIRITYEEAEIPPKTTVVFPEPSENDKITLLRGGCYGSCPSYSVSIRRDGQVLFSTQKDGLSDLAAEEFGEFNRNYVLWSGIHETWVDPKAAANLFEKFRTAHFFGMNDKYRSGVTDNPTYILSLKVGNKVKEVEDYVGGDVGMPAVVTSLEDAVDKLAGSDRWIKGNAETVALLKSEKFDFKSKAAAKLVETSMLFNQRSPEDSKDISAFISAMIDAGLLLEFEVGKAPDNLPLGALIADYSARNGAEFLFEKIAKLGYVKRLSEKRLSDAFTSSMGCSAIIARSLISAGANPKAKGENGNALHELVNTYGGCEKVDLETRVQMAQTLIALGVPLEAHNENASTPLMGCDIPEIVQVFLAAGANVNARNEDGATPLLMASDDRVALMPTLESKQKRTTCEMKRAIGTGQQRSLGSMRMAFADHFANVNG
jgi:Domain of unknown function (DUF6438)